VAKRPKTIRDAETAPEFREAVVSRWRQIIQRHFTRDVKPEISRVSDPRVSDLPSSRCFEGRDRFSGGLGRGRFNEDDDDDED